MGRNQLAGEKTAIMRTTLDIDDDVLGAVKALAKRERKTVGKFASGLMREALHARTSKSAAKMSYGKYGFRPIPAGGNVVSNELVDALRVRLAI